MIGKAAREALADYVEVLEPVEPIEVPRVVPNDPDDDHVIAAACAAQADCITSGDSDLLSAGHWGQSELAFSIVGAGDTATASAGRPRAEESRI